MSDATVVCLRCSRENPPYRLWCVGCAAPLAYSSTSTVSAGERDESLVERADLYQRVLDDLNQVSQEQKIETGVIDAIDAFYSAQLGQIQGHIAEREREAARQDLIAAARSTAYAGGLKTAIDVLEKGLREYPADEQLGHLLAEVSEQFERRELALEASRKARLLLHESKDCLANEQYEEAKLKLEHAAQLEPDNKQVASMLTGAKKLIKEREAAAVYEAEPVVDTSLGEETPQPSCQQDSTVVEEEDPAAVPSPTFAEEAEVPSPTHRFIEAASQWSSIVKPFLLDNVGWFVGGFLVVAGFVVLIFTFWTTIEQNQILMHSLVFASLLVATGIFFAAAYFMRLKYPQLESSSDVLLVIVALLIPLVFAAGVLTALVPLAVPPAELTLLQQTW